MDAYSLSHLSDRALELHLAEIASRDRAITAALLAHMAEFDARQLYLPAAYPSMHAYCVHALRLSEEAAFKRIRAARTARRVPAIFAAPAHGRPSASRSRSPSGNRRTTSSATRRRCSVTRFPRAMSPKCSTALSTR